MDTKIPENRKQIWVNRFLNEVSEYFKANHAPMKLQYLSCKYARPFKEIGGFPELIYELKDQGLIRLEVLKNGARLVYPKDAPNKEDTATWY